MLVAQAQTLGHMEQFVLRVEEACLLGTSLSEAELRQLEEFSVPRVAAALAGAELLGLRSFGHRLWRACAAEGARAIAGRPEAQLRQLACEMFAAGFSGTVAQPDEQALLASHWALAGRAWVLTDGYEASIRCFEAAAKPWQAASLGVAEAKDAAAVRLAEVAVQAHLWAAGAHFQHGFQDLAFAALTKGRDALEASPELRHVMVDDLLKTCHEQAVALRGAGKAELAVELLTLALAAAPPVEPPSDKADHNAAYAAATRALLMRNLALSYLQLQKRALAKSHAQEAVAVGPPSSSHHAWSLQVLLRVLCELSELTDAPGADADPRPHLDEAFHAALELMRHPAAAVHDCIGMCSFALERRWSEDSIFTLLAELDSRVREEAAAYCEALHFRLRLAAKCMEAAIHEGQQMDDFAGSSRLAAVVAEAETLLDTEIEAVARLFEAVVAVLWRVASLVIQTGRHRLASQWLQRATPFIRGAAEVARCWAAVAACFWWAGEREDAKKCVEKALESDPQQLHATLMALLAAAEEGTIGAQATSGLLQRALAMPAILPKHVACIARALLNHPHQDLAISALESLARCLLKQSESAPESAQQSTPTLDALAVACELVERAAAQQQPAADVVHFLGLVEQCVAKQRAAIARELERGEGGSVDKLRRILNAAWLQGQSLGRDRKWALCVAVFEAINQVLEHFDGMDMLEVSEPRAWCFVMVASAKVQLVKESAGERKVSCELCERALHCLDRAHQLCRHAARPRRQDASPGRLESTAAQGTPSVPLRGCTLGRVFTVLVLLEFEVRCLAGDSELQLKHFVDEASSQEAVGIKSLLAMSKIAGVVSSRKLAIHCLQRYLRVCASARGAIDCAQCAPAYREMIALYTSRNDSFKVYENVLHLLTGGGTTASVATSAYPREEVAWLVATAWNNGCHFYRLQQYTWGERWMGKSLALAKFCPGTYAEDKMTAGYIECCKRCGEGRAPA